MSTPSSAFRLALALVGLAGILAPAHALPTVSLTAPTAGATFGNPAQITISATATPTSGSSITKVEFYRGGTTLIATVNAPGPYTTVWNYNVNGTYSLTAKAYDSTGSRTSTARSITIAANKLPSVSISSPANNATFAAPASITINASASDTDGTIAKVEFLSGSTVLNTDTTSPFSYTWTGVPAGTYSLTAKATDNSGGVKTSTAVNVTVTTPPPPPTVSLTSPADGATFQPPANISLAATATAGSGASISKVEFYNGSTLLAPDPSPPYTYAWNAVPAGTYTLTAKATDNKGSATMSAPVTVTVAAPTPPPTVSLTLPASNVSATAPASVQLEAAASATEPATLSRVEFYAGATLLAAPTSAPWAFNWTNVPSGGYAITAKAIDSLGKSAVSAPRFVAVDGADSCATSPPLTANDSTTKLALLEGLPMAFEPNKGQAPEAVRFQVRGPGYQLFLTATESVLALRRVEREAADPASRLPKPGARAESVALRMRFVGANPNPTVAGEEPLAQRSHYLVGRDPAAWRTNVPNFARVRYEGLYRGIDQVVYGRGGQLEYDLVVAPGADPRDIRFALEGARRLAVNREGDLVLDTALGELVQRKPVAYQEVNGERRPVEARYEVARNEVSFAVGPYDRSLPLVIDPVLVYSTFVGGAANGSGANAIALSRCGEAYIAGWTYATDFPTTAGAIRRTAIAGDQMGFVAKLNQAGTALLYSTYLTGTIVDLGDGFPYAQNTEATSIAVDSGGHAFVAGITTATDFPATAGSWNPAPPYPGSQGGFAAKLNTDGTGFLYATYVPAGLEAIAADAAGNAYVAGGTGVWKIDPTGASSLYAFTVGGSGYPPNNTYDTAQAIAVDASGNAYVAGITYSNDLPVTAGAFQTARPNPTETGRATGFLAKINPGGTGLVYGTYLGTAGLTYPFAIAVDGSGHAYVTGTVSDKTGIPNFAGTFTTFNNNVNVAGSYYALMARLNAAGSGLDNVSRIGGGSCSGTTCFAANTRGTAIAVDAAGAAWIAGTTESNQVPLVKPLVSTFATAGGPDLFAAKLAPSGAALAFSTLLGGSTDAPPPANGPSAPLATGIAVDAIGSAYVTGMTTKTDFPTTAGAFQTALGATAGVSAFVSKINETKDTTTALAVSPNPTAAGAATTLTATIAGNAPTGTVTFKDGGATLGTGTVSGTGAQPVTTSLAGGTHSLTAAYGGDAHNNPSTSAAVAVNATDPVTPPLLTMTGIADGASFVAGAGGTYTGATVTLNASAAAGNALTRLTIYFGGTNVFWNVADPTAIQPWSLPALSPGMYTLYATAQDNQGHTTTTAPVRFVVNASGVTPPSAVAITAPANGATFVSPEPIALAATATAGGAAIAGVTFYAGIGAVAQANASPYTATWTGAQPGTYSLMALAMDATGGRRLSAPVTVTVGPPQPPTVAITAPGSGATYTAPATVTVTASATAAAGATISQVEFLQGATVVGTATSSPYTFAWTGVAQGAYTLTARATDSRTSQATSSPVSISVGAGAPALAIAAAPGLDGSTVNEGTVLVNGSISAPPNSGVTVNGMLATVGTDNQFSVNDVPLNAGANTITLVVTTQDGDTASQAITVNSSGAAAPFTVAIDEPDGIAPHTVTFTVSGGSTPVASVEFDVDGNGTVDVTTQGIPAAGVQATYSSARTVRPRITFKDASGSVIYTATKQAHIVDPADKYNLVKGAFSDMVNRLKAGTNSTALNLFFGHAQSTYDDIFTKLGTDLPAIANQLGTVESINFSKSSAEVVMSRMVSGTKQIFMIYLMRGADGIWRIESM